MLTHVVNSEIEIIQKNILEHDSVKISAVRFVGGKAYLVVNVIERGNERVLEFRPSPTGSLELPVDVLSLDPKFYAVVEPNCYAR